MVSDFTYFGELYESDDVIDVVAYVVLAFALFGLVSLLVSPPTMCGHAAGVILEDIPMTIVTTAIQARIVGAKVTEWSMEAQVSYIFSVFAIQQKLMYAGYAPYRRHQTRGGREKPRFCDVLLCSIFVTLIALALAWIAAAIIIFLDL